MEAQIKHGETNSAKPFLYSKSELSQWPWVRKHRQDGIPWIEMSLIGLALLTGAGLAFVSVNLSFAYAIFGLVGLFGVFLVIRRPEVGLLTVVFFIPFEDFNQIGSMGSLSVIKMLSLIVLGAYAIHYMVFQRDQPLVSVPQNSAIALLLIAIMVSNLIAVDQGYAIDKTFKLLRMVAFYFLIINIVRTRSSLHRVLGVMLMAGVIAAGYGLYEYYFRPEMLLDMRVSGPLDDPTNFAYHLVSLIPVAWYFFKVKEGAPSRILFLSIILLFVYAIILSGTRGGIYVMAGVLGLIAIRGKRAMISLAFVAGVMLLALAFMPEQVQSRLGLGGETDKSAESSSERRMTYLTFGVNLFIEKPFLGSGLGGFEKGYSESEYKYNLNDGDVKRIAHNMYVEIATGAGLAGLVPFLLLLVSPLFGLQKIIKDPDYILFGETAKMIQISLMAFLFIGFFSSSQYDKPLWLLISLASVIPVLARRFTSLQTDTQP